MSKLYIKQKFLSIRPRFSVSVDGTEVAEIVKKVLFITSTILCELTELESDRQRHGSRLLDLGRPQ